MASTGGIFFTICTFLSCFTCICGLYEDQVGSFDWLVFSKKSGREIHLALAFQYSDPMESLSVGGWLNIFCDHLIIKIISVSIFFNYMQGPNKLTRFNVLMIVEKYIHFLAMDGYRALFWLA